LISQNRHNLSNLGSDSDGAPEARADQAAAAATPKSHAVKFAKFIEKHSVSGIRIGKYIMKLRCFRHFEASSGGSCSNAHFEGTPVSPSFPTRPAHLLKLKNTKN